MKRDYFTSHEQAGAYWNGGFYLASGTVLQPNSGFVERVDMAEEMWERMYITPKPVIIICGFCKSHNAISNPTCVQCGAPMGYGKER